MNSEECGWLLRVGLIVDDESRPDPSVGSVPARLGIAPTRAWKRGDVLSARGDRRYKTNGFRYDFYHDYNGDSEVEVTRALAWLSSVGAATILEPYDRQIAITVKLYGKETHPVPILSFSKEAVRQASDLGLSIDIDLYVWGSEKPVLRRRM